MRFRVTFENGTNQTVQAGEFSAAGDCVYFYDVRRVNTQGRPTNNPWGVQDTGQVRRTLIACFRKYLSVVEDPEVATDAPLVRQFFDLETNGTVPVWNDPEDTDEPPEVQ
jgi:hypothetical protein